MGLLKALRHRPCRRPRPPACRHRAGHRPRFRRPPHLVFVGARRRVLHPHLAATGQCLKSVLRSPVHRRRCPTARANTVSLELEGIRAHPLPDARSALARASTGTSQGHRLRHPHATDRRAATARTQSMRSTPIYRSSSITGHGDVPMAVRCAARRAFDFIPKPFAARSPDRASVRRALERRLLVLDNRLLRAAAAPRGIRPPLIGESAWRWSRCGRVDRRDCRLPISMC